MAAAASEQQPEVVTNRGELEFKITAPSTTDHDYVVLNVPDLARFQTVVEACAKEVSRAAPRRVAPRRAAARRVALCRVVEAVASLRFPLLSLCSRLLASVLHLETSPPLPMRHCATRYCAMR